MEMGEGKEDENEGYRKVDKEEIDKDKLKLDKKLGVDTEHSHLNMTKASWFMSDMVHAGWCIEVESEKGNHLITTSTC